MSLPRFSPIACALLLTCMTPAWAQTSPFPQNRETEHIFKLCDKSPGSLACKWLATAVENGLPPAVEQIDLCDELAADPDDPNARVRPGVPLERISFSKAVAACEEAVAKHPYEARFQHQLGRANNSMYLRELDDRALRMQGRPSPFYANAAQGYSYAGWLGYAPAWQAHGKMAEASGNDQLAENYFVMARELGSDNQSDVDRFVFDPSIFSNPEFFAAIHQGTIEGGGTAAAAYVAKFAGEGYAQSGCLMFEQVRHAASGEAMLGEFREMVVRSQTQGAAANVVQGAIALEGLPMDVREDVRILLDRYGCNDATRFFLSGFGAWLRKM